MVTWNAKFGERDEDIGDSHPFGRRDEVVVGGRECEEGVEESFCAF